MPPTMPSPAPRNSAWRTSDFCRKLASCNSPIGMSRGPRKCICRYSTRDSSRSFAVFFALSRSGSTKYKRLLIPPPWRNEEFSVAEEQPPCEERVVAFRGHQAHEHEDRPGRQQDGEDQRQPFPAHVHEHRDDQARLRDHEQQDQAPAQQALEVEVIDQVRERAEHEEEAPDREVQADRVLLMLRGGGVVHGRSPYQR